MDCLRHHQRHDNALEGWPASFSHSSSPLFYPVEFGKLLPILLKVKKAMMHQAYVSRVIDLLDPQANVILNMSNDEAIARVQSGDASQVGEISGQFAICAHEGRTVWLARSIGRPMRYFLAKRAEGPCLIVAERMEEIRAKLHDEGLADQFHPSYTRMVPAHHLMRIELVGCPDPNPNYARFFEPLRNSLPTDIEAIGQQYIRRLLEVCNQWLDSIPKAAPVGVLFSGGIDSGAVLLTLYHALLQRGESPSRLKAFTLRVDQSAEDARQAADFVRATQTEMLWEVIDVASSDVDWKEAIRVIEDYKPLDVQSATMAISLCREIRSRYPDWKYLVDGDGGDENMKDYPIEDNPELTIRSVLNNLMLYQEGWGVHAIKHSLVHSGGQSRGHVRTWAPARTLGFDGFSPFAVPRVIEVAEGIPFIELTQWNHEKLYALKGQIVQSGMKSVFGIEMPIFEKRRFQHGAVESSSFNSLFPKDEEDYRRVFIDNWKIKA